MAQDLLQMFSDIYMQRDSTIKVISLITGKKYRSHKEALKDLKKVRGN